MPSRFTITGDLPTITSISPSSAVAGRPGIYPHGQRHQFHLELCRSVEWIQSPDQFHKRHAPHRRHSGAGHRPAWNSHRAGGDRIGQLELGEFCDHGVFVSVLSPGR